MPREPNSTIMCPTGIRPAASTSRNLLFFNGPPKTCEFVLKSGAFENLLVDDRGRHLATRDGKDVSAGLHTVVAYDLLSPCERVRSKYHVLQLPKRVVGIQWL